jgi:hypothetical protein
MVLGMTSYHQSIQPRIQAKKLQFAIQQHAIEAAKRVEQCRGYDWQSACDKLANSGNGGAGARRKLYTGHIDRDYTTEEEELLYSDDPTVTFDHHCLRVYRLKMVGHITFPYLSGQLLQAGGNQTMALFIQHGALRNGEDYFCSFKRLMLTQEYRPFSEILIIAPDFNYKSDALVHPMDAFWNTSKPWGDWRIGAESDPECCGNTGRTVSSFDVLDHMLAILTNRKLFPHMNKISYVGHSAGT